MSLLAPRGSLSRRTAPRRRLTVSCHRSPQWPPTAPTLYRSPREARTRGPAEPEGLEDPNRDPDFVPLAERLKAYVRRDQILAAEGKVVQILPPPKG